jgi:hypothetical protein
MVLESFREELQDCLKPHLNQRSEQEVMDAQSLGSPTWDSFGTPPWESREKVPFGCNLGGELQRILYGGRWWLSPSPGCGESSVSKCLWLVPTPKGVPECELNLLWLVLDSDSCEIIIVSFLSLPGTSSTPLSPPFSAGSRERPQVPTFHNSTYLDPQVGLTRNLGARQWR